VGFICRRNNKQHVVAFDNCVSYFSFRAKITSPTAFNKNRKAYFSGVIQDTLKRPWICCRLPICNCIWSPLRQLFCEPLTQKCCSVEVYVTSERCVIISMQLKNATVNTEIKWHVITLSLCYDTATKCTYVRNKFIATKGLTLCYKNSFTERLSNCDECDGKIFLPLSCV
jgi:hypothetical protein